MVSELTKFFCKPDMPSSWFLRQGSLHAILHESIWKSDHDVLNAFHINFLSGMHGLRDNEVLLQAGYDVTVILHQGVLYAIFRDGLWKSDDDFLIAFYSNFLSGMYGFRDNEVLLQAGYDVNVIPPSGVALRYFTWLILKGRPTLYSCSIDIFCLSWTV